MLKFRSKPNSNWLAEVNIRDASGKAMYAPNGKILKRKVQIEDATFLDGTKWALYFEPSHPKAGLFKGMAVISEKYGLIAESNPKA